MSLFALFGVVLLARTVAVSLETMPVFWFALRFDGDRLAAYCWIRCGSPRSAAVASVSPPASPALSCLATASFFGGCVEVAVVSFAGSTLRGFSFAKMFQLLFESEHATLRHPRKQMANAVRNNVDSFDQDMILGWFVGYVERGDEAYVFACNIVADDKASGPHAKKLVLKVLRERGILPADANKHVPNAASDEKK